MGVAERERLRVLVAPDKFKGTFSAGDVAAAIASGVRRSGGEPRLLAVADGGDGTAEALLQARGGRWIEVLSEDAIGRPVKARYAMLEDGTAVIDVAEASGMWRLGEGELDALKASTRGTGILLADAAESGAREIIVAPGGSATTDAGQGILDVLDERQLHPRIRVACDVESTFEQAPSVFGPQKGADPSQVAELEARLTRFAERAPRDPRGLARGGCGGGLSGGLWAHHGAELVSGAELVLGELGFGPALAEADLLITGEGRIDSQTMLGKAVGVIASRAGAAGVPCHAIVGSRDLTERERLDAGIDSIQIARTLPHVEGAASRVVTAGR